jgi:putative chitinase
MNIHELDSYNLGDAVKFHRRLNPRIWGRDEHLLPEVREKLLTIAADFQEFLGVEDLNVEDITISGSNAAYSYTKNSDIDLHLVVTMPDNPVYQELFTAKKYQYNSEHNIKIGGADVELYVQPSDQAHHSQGIYSIKDSEWRQIPQRKRAQVDDACVRDKVADLDSRIHTAVKSKNLEAIGTLWNKIKSMRQSGLEQQGEFGCENIAFKMLRNSGCIKLLKDAMTAQKDRELSLREAPAMTFRYGYGSEVDEASLADMRAAFAVTDKPPNKQEVFRSPHEYEKVKKQREAERQEKIQKIARTPVKPWPMGVKEGHQGQPYSSEDGVAASTKQFLEDSTDNNIVQDFIQHVTTELGIDPVPEIHLHTDPEWSKHNQSFGRYDPESHTLNVSMPNRHVMDVLRTVAHELVHCSQNQQHGQLPDDAGETGSRWENDANARAGVIMRDWANSHPEHFAHDALEEGASGYIPKNKKEAAMPQYAMALSVDIKPGQTGKEANKLALNTGRNGEPGLLMKTVNLHESVNDYLWHGSKSEHDILYPQQANDTGGKEESNKNAVYATPSARVAIAMGLTTPGSDTGMFPNDPQMVLFNGGIRKGQMIYLHKVPKNLFIKHNDREWFSKPGVKEVKPLEVVTVPVDKWLHLIRQATPADLELQKKYTQKQNVKEYKMPQPSQGPGRYKDLNEPLGPETPPKMPAGTIKVDVSDTQDWYQLGQDISNLDIANKAHYNQGPPHTVLAFGSEDLEHMYIQQLKRLGLNTHDLDEPGEDDLDEGINEGNQLTLRDFVVTVSPHALSQAHNKGVDVHMVDDILRNISKVKDNIMSLEPGRALILHNGQGTGLGVRRGQGNNLTLATVFPTNPGFRKGKHPTFQVEANEVDEGVGSALATAALAGTMAMGAQAKAPEMVHQTVEPGDTVYSIARQNNVNPLEIYRLNKMDRNTKLEVGQRVVVPDYSKPISKMPATVTPTIKQPPAKAAQPAPSLKDKISSIIPKFPSDNKEEEGVTLLSDNTDAEAALQTAAKAAGLTGVELAQFMAQTRHESWDFGKMKEVGNKKQFAKYDAPRKAKQLGNKVKGDGERFKGRGFIQLTGRDNYTRASQQIFGDDRLVKNPDLASRLDVGAQIALWFWKNQVRPNVSNFNNTKEVTNAINPGLSGLQDRHTKFKEYMAVL